MGKEQFDKYTNKDAVVVDLTTTVPIIADSSYVDRYSDDNLMKYIEFTISNIKYLLEQHKFNIETSISSNLYIIKLYQNGKHIISISICSSDIADYYRMCITFEELAHWYVDLILNKIESLYLI